MTNLDDLVSVFYMLQWNMPWTYFIQNVQYDGNYVIDVKLGKFQTINRILRNKVRRDTKLKFYKGMAVPVFMGVKYGQQPRNKTVKYRYRK